MARGCEVTSHYLSQYWPGPMSPYGVIIRPPCVDYQREQILPQLSLSLCVFPEVDDTRLIRYYFSCHSTFQFPFIFCWIDSSMLSLTFIWEKATIWCKVIREYWPFCGERPHYLLTEWLIKHMVGSVVFYFCCCGNILSSLYRGGSDLLVVIFWGMASLSLGQ